MLRFGRGLYNPNTPHCCLRSCRILSVWFRTQSSRHCPLFLQSEVKVPDFPANEAKGSHMVPFTSTIFIEQSDFKEVRGRICKQLRTKTTLTVAGVTRKAELWYWWRAPFAGDGEGLQATHLRAACRPEACWIRHLCAEGYQGRCWRSFLTVFHRSGGDHIGHRSFRLFLTIFHRSGDYHIGHWRLTCKGNY